MPSEYKPEDVIPTPYNNIMEIGELYVVDILHLGFIKAIYLEDGSCDNMNYNNIQIPHKSVMTFMGYKPHPNFKNHRYMFLYGILPVYISQSYFTCFNLKLSEQNKKFPG